MAYRPLLIKGPVYITIAASVRSPDIRALAISAGWVGYEPLYCTINAGVDVATLTVSNLPDWLLTLVVRGRVGGIYNSGTGLVATSKFNLDNAGGVIFGGGGQGGQGQSVNIFRGTGYVATGTGGSGGVGAGFNGANPPVMLPAGSGSSGSSQTVGGPNIGGTTQGTATGGSGGTGGAIGMTGNSGGSASTSGSFESSNYYGTTTGELAGYAIDGIANVNILAAGSILGRTR
ncbi:hypothetical protein [Comamonas squillarum]|uniref:Uncharacterized protein n=1 Tax=Comamonas squillarum TaxID=2977320 RepID=A0ABY5ZXB7_9BURK|nr:hypothetical protein [Comamonas sp. PR12]UXC18566.1 hypothetical protein N4T19_00020 [Comamonas sp. PR12]